MPTCPVTMSGRLGVWLILLGALLNEWILGRVFSRDGILEPPTRLLIWTFDVLLVVFGIGLRVGGIRARAAVDRSACRRRTTIIMGCLVSAVTTLVLMACAEGVCWWLNHRPKPGVEMLSTYHAILDTQHPALGYRLMPGRTARVFVKVKGRTLFDAVYTTDAAGRRLTPSGPSRDAAGTLLFFGDSFTFGEGVSDDETMPFAVARLASQHHVYNYGVPGYGPQHVLAKLEDDAIVRELDVAPPVIGVYTFIDGHVPRAVGTMRHYVSWMADSPCYDLDASETAVVRTGSFRTAQPWRSRLYDFFGRSQVLQYFDFSWPFHFTRRDVSLTCRIIEAARDRFRALFDSDRFYVLFYPGSHYTARIVAQLAARGVRTLDYSSLIDWNDERYHVPYDGHPTAYTHRLIAAQLVSDLHLSMPAPPDGVNAPTNAPQQ